VDQPDRDEDGHAAHDERREAAHGVEAQLDSVLSVTRRRGAVVVRLVVGDGRALAAKPRTL